MNPDEPCWDETQSIAQLKRGDLAGLEALVQRYQVRAVYAAYLVVQDRFLAEDIVQAAFLRLAERIAQYDERRPFGPWFLRSVVNAAIDGAEAQKRTVSLDVHADEDGPAPLDWLITPDPCPEELVETAELRREVRRALEQLTPEQRGAVVLRHFLGMSEREMTLALARPPSTVKWWLHTARERLKDLLRPLWISRGENREEGEYHG